MRSALFLTLALVGAAGVGCGPTPPSVTLESFPLQFARGYCHRVYACCAAPDRSLTSPGSDEASCVAGMTDAASMNADLLFSFGGVGFIEPAAEHCLDVLSSGRCEDIFTSSSGQLIACQDVFAGLRPLGALCGDGRQCISAVCANAACAVPVSCATTDVVSDDNTCIARVAIGAACTLSAQCPAGAACVSAICTQRLLDGAPCSQTEACVGACGPPAANALVGACRPVTARARERRVRRFSRVEVA